MTHGTSDQGISRPHCKAPANPTVLSSSDRGIWSSHAGVSETRRKETGLQSCLKEGDNPGEKLRSAAALAWVRNRHLLCVLYSRC